MSDQVRSWKAYRSFLWSLIVGALAGLAIAGLAYTGFIGEMEPRYAILLGVGSGVGLTLFLTYLLDRVSLGVGSFRQAVKGKGRQGSTKKKAR
jgi:hypothetical protein